MWIIEPHSDFYDIINVANNFHFFLKGNDNINYTKEDKNNKRV